MRRFIIATNKPNLELNDAKVIEMDIKDLPAIFNEDCNNVLNEEQYEELLKSDYMYGIEVEFTNYLTGYRNILNQLYNFDSSMICLFDVSIKRYINNAEFNYFANNKLLPSKLFNVEIESGENKCHYKTIGLESIGLKEFEFTTNLYLNEEDFQIFKAVVTNYIIGKLAKVYINGTQIDYGITEGEETFVFSYVRPKKIFEFFIRDEKYLDDIRYNLISYHWDSYLKLNKLLPDLGQYYVNKAKIYDLENFESAHAEEFVIVCDGINYNQDNLFYAYKYL